MSGKKFLTAVPSALGSVICAVAVAFLATSFTPAIADDDDNSGGTGFDPTGRGNPFMPWAGDNAYKNHRDYAEEVDVQSECGFCHDPNGVGYTLDSGDSGGFLDGPGCLTCHGRKWDSATASGRILSQGTQIMNSVLFGDPFFWTNPQKQHRDYVEDNGVSSCGPGCHSLTEGGKPDSSTFEGQGCLSCHGVKWDDGDGHGDDDSRSGDDDSRSDDRSR